MTSRTRPIVRWVLLATAALVSFLTTFVITGRGAAQETVKPVARFDHLVREDFFAGMSGDRARLDRAMKACDAAIAANTNRAEAMAWRAAGTLYLAGMSFQSGDSQKGIAMWQQALQESDEAVRLEPNNIGVLIPRAASFMAAARFSPPAQAKPLRERVVADYERALNLQQPYFKNMGTHPRGELLAGLAENYHWLGEQEKSRHFMQRVVTELDGTPYQRKAANWLEKPPASPREDTMTCLGCHTSAN